MKRLVCGLALALVGFGVAGSIEVDRTELQSAGPDTVQFENYGGPHAVVETAAAITGIGTALGREVAADADSPRTVQPGAKYTLVHAVGGEGAGMDADILFFNAAATVDHIRNVRRIITGYLEAAYGYGRTDAETIATFVTVYNAVYRGRLDVFSGKYKADVVSHLTAADVGLGTSWQDWPGHTQIVIPLGGVDGGLSTVDTSAISDRQVIQTMRQSDGMGLEPRQNMADLKEREAEEATANAQEAQREAAQQRAAAEASEREADEAQADADTHPEDEEKQRQAEQARQAAADDRQKAEESAQAASTQQQLADKKKMESQNEQRAIARDQERLDGTAEDTSAYITGLFVIDGKMGLYNLMTIDGETGLTVRKSPVTQIRGKTMHVVTDVRLDQEDGENVTFPTLYLAICGVNDSHSAVRLCLIDAATLEIQKESEETLSDAAGLVPYKDDFYVIIQDGGSCYVGRYDKSVTLKSRSAVAVTAASPLNVTDKGLLLMDKDGAPRLLDPDTLETIW